MSGPKYELLPTEPPRTPSSSRSRSLSPPPSSYLPPYESVYSYKDEDIEREAPRRGRSRRREAAPVFNDLDPRFNLPTPSPWARAGVVLFMIFMFWLAFAMRKAIWVETGMGMGRGPVEEIDTSY